MNEQRFITATFCDDIRYEIGNKISLIGCYSGELISSTIPVALPKFCALVNVHTNIKHPFKKLIVKAFFDNVLAVEQEVTENNLLQEDKLEQIKKAEFLNTFSINLQFIFQPLLIEKDTWLSIIAETELGTIQGPYFLIRGQKENENVPTNIVRQTIVSENKENGET